MHTSTRSSTQQRTYIAIDLKSFYASVECVARGLDPLTTHLVVADASRTDKTICLAVSPSLKAYGIGGRARLFEAKQILQQVNARRIMQAPHHRFTGSATQVHDLETHSEYAADMIIAKPRMAQYLQASAQVYRVYLQYVAPEDIHVYSVDEVFMDVTRYLRTYQCNAHELATRIIRDIMRTTGITATAGIGSNLYLCKVAMDIVAKHMPANSDGVRVAELDEYRYRKLLWAHMPITDFWRVGRGLAKRLASLGLLTMGDIARCSLGKASDYYNAQLLYSTFGINAQLLIDHAWGYESCTIADIKAYKPAHTSLSSGQVLQEPYDYAHALLVTKEMTDALVLDVVEQHYQVSNVALAIGYERVSAQEVAYVSERAAAQYVHHRQPHDLAHDHYGRVVPKPAHGSVTLPVPTASGTRLRQEIVKLYHAIVDPTYMIRRITLSFNDLVPSYAPHLHYEQPDLFAQLAHEQADKDMRTQQANRVQQDIRDQQSTRITVEERELQVTHTLRDIQQKFGRSAVMKAMNLEQGATGLQRNRQIGGHAA